MRSGSMANRSPPTWRRFARDERLRGRVCGRGRRPRQRKRGANGRSDPSPGDAVAGQLAEAAAATRSAVDAYAGDVVSRVSASGARPPMRSGPGNSVADQLAEAAAATRSAVDAYAGDVVGRVARQERRPPTRSGPRATRSRANWPRRPRRRAAPLTRMPTTSLAGSARRKQACRRDPRAGQLGRRPTAEAAAATRSAVDAIGDATRVSATARPPSVAQGVRRRPTRWGVGRDAPSERMRTTLSAASAARRPSRRSASTATRSPTGSPRRPPRHADRPTYADDVVSRVSASGTQTVEAIRFHGDSVADQTR